MPCGAQYVGSGRSGKGSGRLFQVYPASCAAVPGSQKDQDPHCSNPVARHNGGSPRVVQPGRFASPATQSRRRAQQGLQALRAPAWASAADSSDNGPAGSAATGSGSSAAAVQLPDASPARQLRGPSSLPTGVWPDLTQPLAGGRSAGEGPRAVRSRAGDKKLLEPHQLDV